MIKEQATSVLKAIKLHCRSNCCCDDMDHWKTCENSDCQLHPFRMGKNPFRKKRTMTDEQRQATADRLKKARDARTQTPTT